LSSTLIESITCLPLAIRLAIAGEDLFPLSRLSDALGVGHRLRATTLSKFGNLSFTLLPMFSAAMALQLRGVGNKPDAFSAMGSAHG